MAHAFPKLTGKTNFIIGLLFGIIVFGGGWWAVSWLGKNDVAVIPTNTSKVFRPGWASSGLDTTEIHLTDNDAKEQERVYPLLIPIVLKSVHSKDVPAFTYFESVTGALVPISRHVIAKKIAVDDRPQWMQSLTGTRELQLIRCFVENKETPIEFRAIHYTLGGKSYSAPVQIKVQTIGKTDQDQPLDPRVTAFLGGFSRYNSQKGSLETVVKITNMNTSGSMEVAFDAPVHSVSYYRFEEDKDGYITTAQQKSTRMEYSNNVQYKVVVSRHPQFFSEVRFHFTGDVPAGLKNTYVFHDDAFFDESLMSLCSAFFCR
jgi:hypothetical protein